MIIGVTGLIASGKDSVGKILTEQYGFTKLYFAEPVYQAVWELNPWIRVSFSSGHFRKLQDIVDEYGWEKAKRNFPEIREYLKTIGYDIGRMIIGVDSWIKILDEKVKSLPPNTDVVITDVRFVNEEWYVHNQGGTLWRTVRPGVGLSTKHLSESGQKDLQVDDTINNNGDLASLHIKVAEALEKIKK